MAFNNAVYNDKEWLNKVPVEWEVGMQELSFILQTSTSKARKFASNLPSFKKSPHGHFYIVCVGDVKAALQKEGKM